MSTLPIELTDPQWDICADPARFRVLVAGRRFGKTHLSAIELMRAAVNIKGSTCWYIAPTYGMAKDAMWPKLKDVIPPSLISGKDETDLRLTLRNGSIIALRSADNPDRLRGVGLDFLVMDEAAYMAAAVWDTVRPALSDKLGRALFISTPSGYNWFHDLYLSAHSAPDWSVYEYTTAQGGNVAAEEIDAARSSMDARQFRQEYEASFESLAGRVYYAFDRKPSPIGNTGDVRDIPGAPLLVGMDFNINPMSAVFAVKAGGQIHIIDEASINNGNTDEMVRLIKQRYPSRRIQVYPDPTGNARKTSAPVGQTDFTILRQAGFSVLSPSSPYPVADKINTANAAMCTAAGVRRVVVSPKCRELIKGLDGLTYKEGTSEPDKSLGLDHITDALGYLLLWEMPMRPTAQRVQLVGV